VHFRQHRFCRGVRQCAYPGVGRKSLDVSALRLAARSL
jgi:hypothetical protein